MKTCKHGISLGDDAGCRDCEIEALTASLAEWQRRAEAAEAAMAASVAVGVEAAAERDTARSDATRERARADAAVEGAAEMRGRLEAAEAIVAATRRVLRARDAAGRAGAMVLFPRILVNGEAVPKYPEIEDEYRAAHQAVQAIVGGATGGEAK